MGYRNNAHLLVQTHYHPEQRYTDKEEIKPHILAIINTIKELLPPIRYIRKNSVFLQRLSRRTFTTLADFAASLTTSSRDELQDILETLPLLKLFGKSAIFTP
ncbi:MAG: hypothetical protein R3E08_01560 [Thiotrichaceae bacterium]